MARLDKQFKEKFGYDVSELPAWTSNTMPSVITDLIETSDFLSLMKVEEGVKGTKEIALLNADVTLQAKVACTPSPDGSLIFTKRSLTTVPLYAGIEFCNESLNGKMTEVLNSLGLKAQNNELPMPLNEILMAYLLKQLQKKSQDLVVSGDTTSLNAELVLMNGLRHLLVNDAEVLHYDSNQTAVTSANAYDIAIGVYEKVPAEVFDAGMAVTLYTGRTEARNIIKQWNASNPYDRVMTVSDGNDISFTLPQTEVTVKSLPQLTGKGEMYAIPMDLVYLGVDSPEDATFDVKYIEYYDKLKAEASFRLGVQIVFPQYFVRLKLTNS